MSTQLDEHRQLLSDQRRVDCLARAVAMVVRPGDVVLDVASGTGILGLLACRAGASRVYCIEQNAIIELARELARANGFDDRLHFFMAHSSLANLPEKVDVIVCDQIGHFGFEAGIVETLADVRLRFLKPQGRVLPSAVTLHVAALELATMRNDLDFWSAPLAGLNLSPGGKLAVNSGHPVTLDPENLLSPGVPVYRMDMLTMPDAPFDFDTKLVVTRDGTLDGIGGWFDADLGGGVTMTNAPDRTDRIDRRNVVFPIERPVPVKAGDEVGVRMRIRASDLLVRWTVRIRSGQQFSYSTLGGMLLTREEMQRTDPRSMPRLTERGEARKTVLSLCDGVRSLDCIEREVYGRHTSLFRDYTDAQLFVAEVVTRYSE